MSWTGEGIASAKDSVSRADRMPAALAELGVRLETLLWTVGQYDAVAVFEADDDETMAAALLALGGQGTVRTTTMLAYDIDAMRRIVAKLD
jgi:uncharacterized protein with GYD domain